MTPNQIKRVCEIQWNSRRVADPLRPTGWMFCTYFPNWIADLIKWPTWTKTKEDDMPDQGTLMLILCSLCLLKLLIDTGLNT